MFIIGSGPIIIGQAAEFEPLTLEDVLSVVKKENPIGVLLQYGGQDMAILRSDEDVCTYLERFNKRYPNEFVLIDQYLEGVEFEVDFLSFP